MSKEESPLSVMMVAGEASADLHGSELVKELNKRGCHETYGVGGSAMRALGFQAHYPAEAISVAGLTEVVFALPRLIRMLRGLVELAVERQPDLIVLIDLPDFNLRLAKRLKRRGFKVVYYISPQLWAWRKKRVELIRRYVDRMLVILPFEEAFYREHKVSVDFVGHPLVEEVQDVMSPSEARNHFELQPDAKVLALLPGSRRKEVERLLPTMLETFQRLRAHASPPYRFDSNRFHAARGLAARPGTTRTPQGCGVHSRTSTRSRTRRRCSDCLLWNLHASDSSLGDTHGHRLPRFMVDLCNLETTCEGCAYRTGEPYRWTTTGSRIYPRRMFSLKDRGRGIPTA